MLTRSETIIQGLIIFLILHVLSRIILKEKIKKSNIKYYILSTIIILMILFRHKYIILLSQLMLVAFNSWRQASNVIGFGNFSFFPNPLFRSEIANTLEYYNFPWMKEAIFSFLPWMLYKFGLLFLLIYSLIFWYFLKKIIRKLSFKFIKRRHLVYIIYALIHAAVLAPKYNTSILLLIPLTILIDNDRSK